MSTSSVSSVLLVVLLGAATTPGLVWGRSGGSPPEAASIKYFEATESEERVVRLKLPTRGSEDQRHLLKKPAVSTAGESRNSDQPETTFRLQVTAPEGQPFELGKVRGHLTKAWYESHRHPTVRVPSQQPNRGTYLNQADASATFAALLFEWDLADLLAEKTSPLTAELLETYAGEVHKLFGPAAEYRISSSPAEAATQASKLRRLQEDCDREAIIVLVAPKAVPFEGKKIWDVMYSLGLGWGDFDLFNWVDDEDSPLFSVSTSTEPGYFLPEMIVANELLVEDLVFSFTIPGTYDAPAVFEAMLAAAEYSKKRLGGRLVDETGKELDSHKIRAEIARIDQRLAEAGLARADAPAGLFGSHNVRAALFMQNRAYARELLASPQE